MSEEKHHTTHQNTLNLIIKYLYCNSKIDKKAWKNYMKVQKQIYDIADSKEYWILNIL